MFDRVCQTFDELYLIKHDTAVRRLNQMSRQCRSKVELIQLGSAHVATSIYGMRKK